MPFCCYCGTKLPDESRYCFRCGSSLEQRKAEELTAEVNPVKPSTEYTRYQTRKVTARTAFKCVLIVSLIVVVLVVSLKLVMNSAFGIGASNTSIPGSKVVTVKMPPTQVDCPVAGQARAAITRPLASGKDQNVVFVDNKIQPRQNIPLSATIERYDIATNHVTSIVYLPGVSIHYKQVSADGQWILFAPEASPSLPTRIQMIRMDGQGLQTLYCLRATETFDDMHLSPNQQFLAVATTTSSSVPNGSSSKVTIINLHDGTLFPALTSDHTILFDNLQWVDNSRLYLENDLEYADQGPTTIYMLTVLPGKTQQASSLVKIYNFYNNPIGNSSNSQQGCWSYSLSPDGRELFVSSCVLNYYPPITGNNIISVEQGPGAIGVEPSTGGMLHSVYINPSYAISEVVAVSQTELIFYISNSSNDPARNLDTSQNGWWKIQTDGSGLTRLTTDIVQNFGDATEVSQNGQFFAFYSIDVNNSTSTLAFSSLSGGSVRTFLTTSGNENSGIAGWTVM